MVIKTPKNPGYSYDKYYLPQRPEKVELALSTSKFQPTDARRAFPNFDEPEYKATYTTTIIHDADHHAMSNMDPEETVQRSDGYLQTTFPITPRMSSYLTAYIVSDFINTNTTITNTRLNKTIPFRVWTHADQIDQTLYALDIGKRMHEYFENEWFDVEYPMLKSDMVAVPDYPSGATEHWGIITYRETNLLYDPDVSSESNKQRVAVVIGHELAHLWFGNLVTCLWWNDLWLNEGFASYLEYEGVNYVHPDWLMYDQFLTSDLFYAMEQDQIVSSHPIIQPLEHPDKINEIFDSITYSKGSSILRMLESIMGEDFRTGIKNYMNKYKFSSATTADLWNTLTDHTYFDVPRVMDTWTLQMGYPVITIKRSHDHAGKAFVRLTQTRFLIDPEAEDTTYSPYDYEWYVRFDYQSENGEYAYEWMDRSEAIFEWPSDNSTWIKANVNQTGVYRVNYDEENWIALVKQLREYHMALSAGDRAGLLNDAFNLAWAGYVNYSIALDLTRYLENEEDFVPWDTITDIFNDLSVLLYHRQAYGNWRNYIQQQVKSIYNELKFVENDDDGHLTKYLRGNILSLACGNGHADCLEAALDYFEKWKNNERYLDYVWDDNIIRSQDFFTVVNYIANNPVATAVVWDWVRVNWQKMVDKFGLNYRLLGRLIPGVTNTFTTELQLQEMQHFFDMYPEAGTGARGREQALEHVQSNINWLKRYENEITSWLTINV
uniref:glutamyl aminopeptidase n=1 Tax=Saccoglossus kowalevskii TaxID=10224 RepID=A0ABM0LU30_SACKO|nr:PREDICTED: glutamyl aminopeptidase-like [Saccoglossus kowalevskii]